MARNRNEHDNLPLEILIQPNIGLDGDVRHSVIEILNTVLADEIVLTLKTRSAYWHIKGHHFLSLQALLDQQLHQVDKMADEIAERVCILGGMVISSFEEYLTVTRLKEQPGHISELIDLLADHEALVRFLREDARRCFEEFEDHGTFALFVNFIRQHEKTAWNLRSYIIPEVSPGDSLEDRLRTT